MWLGSNLWWTWTFYDEAEQQTDIMDFVSDFINIISKINHVLMWVSQSGEWMNEWVRWDEIRQVSERENERGRKKKKTEISLKLHQQLFSMLFLILSSRHISLIRWSLTSVPQNLRCIMPVQVRLKVSIKIWVLCQEKRWIDTFMRPWHRERYILRPLSYNSS